MEPTIYLNFKGNCLEAMTHYAKVLGGEISGVFLNKDTPAGEERMSGDDDMVLNMNMKLGTANVMASDAPAEWYSKPQGFSVSIAPSSPAEFDRIYGELSKGAEAVMMPPMETFWAERFAMFTDRYGTPWMLNYAGSKAMG